MIIQLGGAAPASDQIRDQIRGLVASGALAADQRIPSVRQLARDLAIAPGTVAKAYRALEAEGILVSRPGSGTRVSRAASTIPRSVLEAARALAEASVRAGVDRADALRVLGAVWPEG